jgi:hypothetical protein
MPAPSSSPACGMLLAVSSNCRHDAREIAHTPSTRDRFVSTSSRTASAKDSFSGRAGHAGGEWILAVGGVFLGSSGCATGRAGEAEELPAVGVVVMVVGYGLRLRGIIFAGNRGTRGPNRGESGDHARGRA